MSICLFLYQVGSYHIARACTGSEVVSCLFCCRFPGNSSSNESGFPDSQIRHFYGKKNKINKKGSETNLPSNYQSVIMKNDKPTNGKRTTTAAVTSATAAATTLSFNLVCFRYVYMTTRV